jgi:hypothetical protein
MGICCSGPKTKTFASPGEALDLRSHGISKFTFSLMDDTKEYILDSASGPEDPKYADTNIEKIIEELYKSENWGYQECTKEDFEEAYSLTFECQDGKTLSLVVSKNATSVDQDPDFNTSTLFAYKSLFVGTSDSVEGETEKAETSDAAVVEEPVVEETVEEKTEEPVVEEEKTEEPVVEEEKTEEPVVDVVEEEKTEEPVVEEEKTETSEAVDAEEEKVEAAVEEKTEEPVVDVVEEEKIETSEPAVEEKIEVMVTEPADVEPEQTEIAETIETSMVISPLYEHLTTVRMNFSEPELVKEDLSIDEFDEPLEKPVVVEAPVEVPVGVIESAA